MSGFSPDFSPAFSEMSKELSLFDADTKDSGFAEEIPEDFERQVTSPLSLDNENTITFSPFEEGFENTPSKGIELSSKKRLRPSPTFGTPCTIAASSLKRLKLFDNCEGGFPEDFSDTLLVESSDDVLDGSPSSIDVKRNIVKIAVEKSEAEDLIGDFSKCYALPVVSGSHPDLKCITVDTMKDILLGKYNDIITSVKIIDSRYPYEYNGGHIRGALNIYTKEECLKLLDTSNNSKDERHVLIFHCEFSKERGPTMLRSLRQEDRTNNRMNYPALKYPEVYLLDGGYKTFYQSYPEYCDPISYTEMLNPEFNDEMKFFRKKSKTADLVLKTNRKKMPQQKDDTNPKRVRRFLSNDF